MSLTDSQIRQLCGKMNIPLADIVFKDQLPKHLEFNKAYFINLEDEYDDKGYINSGSHWTTLVIIKYPTGEIDPLYMDFFGMPPAEIVKKRMMDTAHKKIPFNTKNCQSLMANCCGFFCLAYQHYIFNFPHRTGDLYLDTEKFLEYFDDLNKSIDFKRNEWVLRHFFQNADPKMRKEIDVIVDTDIITDDTNGGIDAFK